MSEVRSAVSEVRPSSEIGHRTSDGGQPVIATTPRTLAPATPVTPWQAWQGFWFTPISPVGLHALRVLAGLLFIAWLLPFAGQVDALFGLTGWFDRQAYLETSRLPALSVMLLNWSVLYVAGTSVGILHAFYWGALIVFLLFTLGIATRITSVLTWLLVVSFQSSPAIRFDADYLLGILAFYLMIGYVFLGQWSSPLTTLGRLNGGTDTFLFGSKGRGPSETTSYAANLAIRLLQVHFALIVVASGLHKLQFGMWWSGAGILNALHPPFTLTDSEIGRLTRIRDNYLLLNSVVTYAALAWQLGFPFYAWRRGWMRLVLLGGALLGWLASWYVYQLPLFGPFYLIGCLSYLTPSEWLELRSRAARLVGRVRPRNALFILFAFGVSLAGIGCPPTDTGTRKSPSNDTPTAPPSSDIGPPTSDVGHSVLQTRIDAALQMMRNRDLELGHSFWTVFHEILGVGPESAMLHDQRTGKREKALDYICNGGKLRGLEFKAESLNRADVVTMAGSGTGQGHQDQFIAEMAQWGMPPDKTILVEGKPLPFEAFTRFSRDRTSIKAKPKQELSWAIIIIAQYYGTNITWTNNAGEMLHFDDVVRYELHEPIKESPACGGTHRLFGLSWAYHLHMAKGGEKTAIWKEVEKLSREYIDLAKKLQNPDGSFSTEYFRGPGNNQTDLTLRIHSTGHILEWLALALNDQELHQPWMENAAEALTTMLLNNRYQGLDGGAVYHAVHGLEIYRNRVFGPTPYPPQIPLPPK
jgi:hypothetical protein